MTKRSFLRTLLLSAALGFSFLLGGAFPMNSSAQSGNEVPAFSNQDLNKLANDFVTALNKKDKAVLSTLCDGSYYKKLEGFASDKKDVGQARLIGASQRVLDTVTSCFYVEWQYKDITQLSLVTVRAKGTQFTVCYGPNPKDQK